MIAGCRDCRKPWRRCARHRSKSKYTRKQIKRVLAAAPAPSPKNVLFFTHCSSFGKIAVKRLNNCHTRASVKATSIGHTDAGVFMSRRGNESAWGASAWLHRHWQRQAIRYLLILLAPGEGNKPSVTAPAPPRESPQKSEQTYVQITWGAVNVRSARVPAGSKTYRYPCHASFRFLGQRRLGGLNGFPGRRARGAADAKS